MPEQVKKRQISTGLLAHVDAGRGDSPLPKQHHREFRFLSWRHKGRQVKRCLRKFSGSLEFSYPWRSEKYNAFVPMTVLLSWNEKQPSSSNSDS